VEVDQRKTCTAAAALVTVAAVIGCARRPEPGTVKTDEEIRNEVLAPRRARAAAIQSVDEVILYGERTRLRLRDLNEFDGTVDYDVHIRVDEDDVQFLSGEACNYSAVIHWYDAQDFEVFSQEMSCLPGPIPPKVGDLWDCSGPSSTSLEVLEKHWPPLSLHFSWHRSCWTNNK
jgi:hypothetical protein